MGARQIQTTELEGAVVAPRAVPLDLRIDGALILADESAEWKVAGLPQIVRLALALDEYATAANLAGPLPACLFRINAAGVDPSAFPKNPRLTHLSFTNDFDRFAAEAPGEGFFLIVNTHLLFDRGGIVALLETVQPGNPVPAFLVRGAELTAAVGKSSTLTPPATHSSSRWFYLKEPADISAAEKQLLRNTGKSQDGIISRFVNRPVSRAVSRQLARFNLLPNQWTLIIFFVPLLGAIFLLRGDYLGFAIGAILFQLHSALDGCDGEIARVKYQESTAGRKLDALCDRFSTLLYAIALGVGMARRADLVPALRWFYPLEGVIAAALIGVSETWLTRAPLDQEQETFSADSRYPEFVRSQRAKFNEGDQLKLWALKKSGFLFFGERAASLFSELTKRDVFNFAFMVFAICGWPQMILHILGGCGVGIAIFAVKGIFAKPSGEPNKSN